jgi:hypothetical protein
MKPRFLSRPILELDTKLTELSQPQSQVSASYVTVSAKCRSACISAGSKHELAITGAYVGEYASRSGWLCLSGKYPLTTRFA